VVGIWIGVEVSSPQAVEYNLRRALCPTVFLWGSSIHMKFDIVIVLLGESSPACKSASFLDLLAFL